ncbi:hypothetical protein ACJMK2_018904 [Sinanodonta woodiana]|uniref:FUN14 domain-containing protein 1 n=1 Tax=Sinanodonta woodiana TaxID=1069815 RepID=A0ABD3UES4_SINWO
MADNEEYEILDLSAFRRQDRNWPRNIFQDISRQSVLHQVLIGGGTGWVSGYLFLKVGKIAAVSLGLTLLLIKIAQHQGYIKIDWPKVQQEINQTRKRLERDAMRQYPNVMNNIREFVRKNVFLAGSFAGGFLLGVVF